MRETGRLGDAEYAREKAMPLRPASMAAEQASAPSECGRYYQEEVRRQLVAQLGGKQVLRGGLRVYTGYDPGMQCAAESVDLGAHRADFARSRSPSGEGSRRRASSRSTRRPGEVRALVGGRDFQATSYNRATQARRQPGSAFKPIIYAAALERGMAPASILTHLDEPIMTDRGPWLPSGEHEASEYTLREALKISSNRAAAQLLQQVGLSQATYYAQRLGIQSPLPSVPSLALGTGGVTLLELTSAYGVFANQGVAVAPHLITRVEDATGQTLWQATIRCRPRGRHGRDGISDEQHACRRHHLRHRHRPRAPPASSCRRRGRPAPRTTTPTHGLSATRRISSPASGSAWTSPRRS